ncbi:MAG: HEAT repeat domain-containing protein [Nitrospinota bacterium]|nr:HEAT repeat domain-containing protein [Nitrospinota bacterium]
MFEGYKIKKAMTELISNPGEVSLSHAATLGKYGSDGLKALIDAFRGNRIVQKDMELYLNAFYEKKHSIIFIEFLGDNKEEVRSLISDILLKKGGGSITHELIDFLREGDFLQRRGATELLKKLGTFGIVDKILPMLDSKSRDIKGSAMEILAEIGGKKVLASLLPLISSEDWWIRKRAVTALGKMKDPNSLEPLYAQLKVENDPKITTDIIQILGDIGNPDMAKNLLPNINNSDMVVRQTTVDAISKTASVDIIRDVIAIIKGGDVNVRRAGVEVLQNLRDTRATETLIIALGDPDWWVREIATDALANMKSKGNDEKILKLFENPNENVRRAAVEYFVRCPSHDAYDNLIKSLKDKDWMVREKAIEGLGKLKDERAVDSIIELGNDADVRWGVPRALAAIGGDKAIVFLGDFLADPDRAIRLSALTALGNLKAKAALPLIKGIVKDADTEIRNAALQIIKEMTGHTVKANEIIAEQEREEMMGGGVISSSIVPDKTQILTEAILVLDLVGSTDMSANYGDEFALRVTSRLVETSKPIAARNRVRFTKSTGDGYLMTFSEIDNALKFAMEVSKTIEKNNLAVPDNEKIDIRIALNYGETRVDTKGDRLGTAVNMTFRVEGVKPDNLIEDEGGMKPEELPLVNRILITEYVKKEIDKSEQYKIRYVGFFELKGISGRHRIYQVILD